MFLYLKYLRYNNILSYVILRDCFNYSMQHPEAPKENIKMFYSVSPDRSVPFSRHIFVS